MSITIQQIALPAERQVTLEIREPGVIRHVAFGTKEQSLVALPGARSSRNVESLVLFAEVDPAAPMRVRKFALIIPGIEIEPNEGYLAEWRGVAVSGSTGAVVYVYEIVESSIEGTVGDDGVDLAASAAVAPAVPPGDDGSEACR